jgi:hypothetical protein
MADTLSMFSQALGVPVWVLAVFLIWSLTWKLLALWKAARKNSVVWFIVLAVVNTMGVFEILYIFLFSKMHLGMAKKQTNVASKKKAVKKRK